MARFRSALAMIIMNVLVFVEVNQCFHLMDQYRADGEIVCIHMKVKDANVCLRKSAAELDRIVFCCITRVQSSMLKRGNGMQWRNNP
jgi:hypothetical protein